MSDDEPVARDPVNCTGAVVVEREWRGSGWRKRIWSADTRYSPAEVSGKKPAKTGRKREFLEIATLPLVVCGVLRILTAPQSGTTDEGPLARVDFDPANRQFAGSAGSFGSLRWVGDWTGDWICAPVF